MNVRERKSRGKTVWCVQIRVAGHTPESRTLPTRKLALEWGQKRENELKYGITNSPNSSLSGKTPSLRELNDRYRVLHRVSVWESNVLNKLLSHSLCNKPIGAVTEEDVLGLKDHYLSERGVKPVTLQKYLRILRRPIKKARTKWGYRGLIDPFEDIGIKATDKPREREMFDEEYDLIVSYLNKVSRRTPPREMSQETFKKVLDLALETAMRRGEMVKIRKTHILENFTLLHIPETKTGASRTIPLSPKASRILKELKLGAKGDFLLPVTPKAITNRFTRVCHKLGIKDLHFHDLRHTALSRYDRLGFSKGMLKLIGGHKTDKMLFRYLHADLAETLERMGARCAV